MFQKKKKKTEIVQSHAKDVKMPKMHTFPAD